MKEKLMAKEGAVKLPTPPSGTGRVGRLPLESRPIMGELAQQAWRQQAVQEGVVDPAGRLNMEAVDKAYRLSAIIPVIRYTLGKKHYKDAEDIAQEVLLAVHQSFNDFEWNSSFHTWVRKITVNEALGFLRRKNARKRGGDGTYSLDELLRANHGITDKLKYHGLEEQIGRKITLDRIWEVVRDPEVLNEKQRQAMELAYWGDCSMKEAAEIIREPENTIKTHIFRAKKKIREALIRQDWALGHRN